MGAIDDGDFAALRDELGDLLLQVVFHAALAKREGHFDLNDVIEAITAKLVRRHPHVFGRSEARDPDAILRQWDMIKHRETTAGQTNRPPLFDHQPALIVAQKLLGRAERLGFKRPGPLAPGADGKATPPRPKDRPSGAGSLKAAEAELGESLLALVEQARRQGIEAELALRQACARMALSLDRIPRGE